MFDQYKRDIPYSRMAQSLQTLVRPILGQGEVDLERWRGKLPEALGPNHDRAEIAVDSHIK